MRAQIPVGTVLDAGLGVKCPPLGAIKPVVHRVAALRDKDWPVQLLRPPVSHVFAETGTGCGGFRVLLPRTCRELSAFGPHRGVLGRNLRLVGRGLGVNDCRYVCFYTRQEALCLISGVKCEPSLVEGGLFSLIDLVELGLEPLLNVCHPVVDDFGPDVLFCDDLPDDPAVWGDGA